MHQCISRLGVHGVTWPVKGAHRGRSDEGLDPVNSSFPPALVVAFILVGVAAIALVAWAIREALHPRPAPEHADNCPCRACRKAAK